jgi:Rv2525c-like, glycoside hydrolase-like domain
VVACLAVGVAVACGGDRDRGLPAGDLRPSPASSPTESPSADPTSAPSGRTHRTRPPVLTPEGMWWGVDSSGPITAAAIANVRDWYQGARPQFWGRYVSGEYAVTRSELAFARRQGLYVYLLVNDRNCSQCAFGGDICGNDLTRAQARADAHAALRAAARLGLPHGTVLFKDIEQVSSCRREPSADYLDAWYRTLKGTDFVTGFYGNAYQQNYDFPRGYCAEVKRAADSTADVVLDMNEDEPLIGTPRGKTGPDNAPPFDPLVPWCAPDRATVIWQYGESLDPANYTDIDQARPDTPGMLAPDGTVTVRHTGPTPPANARPGYPQPSSATMPSAPRSMRSSACAYSAGPP